MINDPPRKKSWLTTPSWSGLFFLVFCGLVYWCFSPPQQQLSAPSRYGQITVTLGDKFPYWSIITSTVVMGIIWLMATAAWFGRRDMQSVQHVQSDEQAPKLSRDNGSTSMPSVSAPIAKAAPGVAPAEIERLFAQGKVQHRAEQAKELCELIAISVIRAGIEDDVMAGMGGDAPAGLMQAVRCSIAPSMLAEAHRHRPLEVEDALFLHLLTGEFMEAAAEPSSAWEFVKYMAASPDFESLDDQPEWIRLLEYCSPYNRAVADSETTRAASHLLESLVADFQQPWSATARPYSKRH